MVIPYDEERRRHAAVARASQRYRRWDFEATPRDDYPLLLHFPYYLLYSQPGGQAGRPRVRPVRVRRPLRRRAEAARLRLLRAHHGARLVAVGVHPGDRRGRGRAARARLRLLRRDGLRRPARPRVQHRGRPAPGLAGGDVARRGGGLRRHARPRGHAGLRAAAAEPARAAGLPAAVPRAAAARRGPSRTTPPTSCWTGSRSSSCTTASASRSARARRTRARCPTLHERPRPEPPPGRKPPRRHSEA